MVGLVVDGGVVGVVVGGVAVVDCMGAVGGSWLSVVQQPVSS